MAYYSRVISDKMKAKGKGNPKAEYNRTAAQTVNGNATLSRLETFIRLLPETLHATDIIQQLRAYFRGLYDEAGSIAETTRRAGYYRTALETVQTEGSMLRHLLIFIRIATISFVRDFILTRFLIAREELVIISAVTREIILVSKIG